MSYSIAGNDKEKVVTNNYFVEAVKWLDGDQESKRVLILDASELNTTRALEKTRIKPEHITVTEYNSNTIEKMKLKIKNLV